MLSRYLPIFNILKRVSLVLRYLQHDLYKLHKVPRLRVYDGLLVAPSHAGVLCLYLGFICKRDAATVSLFSLIVSFMRPVLIPLGQIKLKFATQIQLTECG